MHGADPFARNIRCEDLATRCHLCPDRSAREHARFQPPIRIGDIHPDGRGAGLAVHFRFNKGNSPGECFPRKCLDREFDNLPVPEPGQIGFVGIQKEPQAVQVGDLEKGLSRLDVVALMNMFLNDNAPDRGPQFKLVGRFPNGDDFIDLIGEQVPQAKFFTGGNCQGTGGIRLISHEQFVLSR